jgi:hypothetical protein
MHSDIDQGSDRLRPTERLRLGGDECVKPCQSVGLKTNADHLPLAGRERSTTLLLSGRNQLDHRYCVIMVAEFSRTANVAR